MDAIPLISQLKSGVQLIFGDEDGALETQKNFVKQCPGVSQVTSVVQLVAGDEEGALRTQKEFCKGVYSVAQGTPLVGHGLGAIHYIAGDREGGDQAMKSASRSTGVLAGALVGGIPGALAGGAIMDSAITFADSAVHDEFRPCGNMKLLESYNDPGVWCDAVGGTALDCYGGRAARRTFRGHLAEGMSVKKAVAKTTIKRVKPNVKKLFLKKTHKKNENSDSSDESESSDSLYFFRYSDNSDSPDYSES